MAKICEHCGKKPQVGHQVSHSNRKTLRRFLPNLISTRIFRPQKKRFEVIKVCSRCLRTLVKRMT